MDVSSLTISFVNLLSVLGQHFCGGCAEELRVTWASGPVIGRPQLSEKRNHIDHAQSTPSVLRTGLRVLHFERSTPSTVQRVLCSDCSTLSAVLRLLFYESENSEYYTPGTVLSAPRVPRVLRALRVPSITIDLSQNNNIPTSAFSQKHFPSNKLRWHELSV